MAGNCWGQNGATINKASNTATVHTRKQTIYVDGPRQIYIPELRINRSTANTYDWYVHWYPESGVTLSPASISINVEEAGIRGGEFSTSGLSAGASYDNKIYSSPSRLFTDNNNGYWWARKADAILTNHAVDASAITVSLSAGSTEGKLICDISNNTNDTWSNNVYQEPTLLKRYVYEIKSAKEYVDELNANGPEEYNIDFPKGSSTINFSMPALPTNYFWGSNSPYTQGERFVYSISENGSYTDFTINIKGTSLQTRALSSQQVQQVDLSSVTEPITYYVKARNGDSYSPVLAKFTFNPIEGAGFEFEENLSVERKPWENKDLYEEIGVVDFDLENTDAVTAANNVSPTPLPQDETVYGFLQKNIASVYNNTNIQNQYGLFKSANDATASKHSAVIGGTSAGKTYLWIPTVTNSDLYGSKALYDRTHHNDATKNGYFYYIDASDDPGTIVDVSIDGNLCGYTELVVVAWLSDMTRAGLLNERFPLAPNINLILKGYDKHDNKEVILHRFTSGDAKTLYNNNVNQYLMQWQQLCYRITLTDENIENYSNFHLEVQNNEPHTDGADYAIDDVRIYKTLPNIEVYRENVCESSSLKISTDYATILRNMGWTKGELVATDDEFDFSDFNNLDFRKFRYGLMGDSHQFINSTVGNVYFAFYDDKSGEWQTVNEAVADYSGNAAHSLRVAVSTVQSRDASGGTNGWEFYTNSETEALTFEQMMNLRAVNDYNNDIEDWQTKEGPDKHPGKIETSNIGTPGDPDFNEEEYQKALIELFGRRLDIPRLRCPWYDETNEHLYLAIIDVNNTSLRYQGEVLDDEGTKATGEYQVITFSAEAIAKVESTGGTYQVNPDDPCTLMSPFVVYPSTTVLIDAVSPGVPGYAVCMGTVHQIQAYLNFFDNGSPVSEDLVKGISSIGIWDQKKNIIRKR